MTDFNKRRCHSCKIIEKEGDNYFKILVCMFASKFLIFTSFNKENVLFYILHKGTIFIG